MLFLFGCHPSPKAEDLLCLLFLQRYLERRVIPTRAVHGSIVMAQRRDPHFAFAVPVASAVAFLLPSPESLP